MELDQEKSELRSRCAKARKAANAGCNQEPACEFLSAHLQAIPALETVSGYWPIRTEIDPRPAMKALYSIGVQICLPVVIGAGEVLEFRLWEPNTPMIESSFGVMVPKERALVEPEALIVPLLAFDQEGHRLGYGGGFYDRTLKALREKRRTYGVGFAYSAQLMDHVPNGPHDQHLDVIVTETGTVLPS